MATLQPQQLDAYFNRIQLPSASKGNDALAAADLPLLRRLISQHQRSIPFENLSLVHPVARQQDGGKILTDLQDVFDKLVIRRRGGYCFEQNSLFAAVLRTLGFDMYTTAARVYSFGREPAHPDEVPLNGFDHQLTLVSLEGQWWAADVGFGSQVPRQPVPLQAKESLLTPLPSDPQHRGRRGIVGSRKQPGYPRRPHSEGWYMQGWSESKRQWEYLYFFTEVEFTLNDYRMANFYTSTHPDMFFTKDVVASIFTDKGRVTLNSTTLKVYQRQSAEGPLEVTHQRELASDEEMDAALEQYFGIKF